MPGACISIAANHFGPHAALLRAFDFLLILFGGDVVVLLPFEMLAILPPHGGKMRLAAAQVTTDADRPKAITGHLFHCGGIVLRRQIVSDFGGNIGAVFNGDSGVAHASTNVVPIEIDDAIAVLDRAVEPSLICVGWGTLGLQEGFAGECRHAEHATYGRGGERTAF